MNLYNTLYNNFYKYNKRFKYKILERKIFIN